MKKEQKKIPAVAPKDAVKEDLTEGADRFEDVVFEYKPEMLDNVITNGQDVFIPL